MNFGLKYSYEEMKKSTAIVEGMKIIEGDINNLRAKISTDIIYCNRDGVNLKLRMIYPEHLDETKKYPLYFHVQGSAWMKQDLNNHILDFKDIVRHGFIVAIVEYRHSGIAKFPAQVIDAKNAMRYIMKHSDELKVDINNVFVSGDSSGGHISLLCWATWKNNKLDEEETDLCDVRGFIDFYGCVDLNTMGEQFSATDHNSIYSPEAILIGERPKDNPKLAEKASVPYYLNEESNDDPLLIMHGNKDRLVPFEQSVQLYELCKKYNKNAKFFAVDNADHGGSAFYCKAVIDEVIKYLDENMK